MYTHSHMQVSQWWSVVCGTAEYQRRGQEETDGFFTRMGHNAILPPSKLIPELVMYYDLLQRFGNQDNSSIVMFLPMSADSYRPHCLYTTVAFGYKSHLSTIAIKQGASTLDDLSEKYTQQQSIVEEICDTPAFNSYTHAHRTLLRTHLLMQCSSDSMASTYSKTKPAWDEDKSAETSVEIRKHPQSTLGEGCTCGTNGPLNILYADT